MTIEQICEKYRIVNYTINDDGTVDVDGDVDLSDKELTKLPLKFNRVSGHFNIVENKLTSLVGCPVYVGDNFDCSDNYLTSLKDGPKKVGGSVDCSYNKLTDLKGSPIEVEFSFHCADNNLTSLIGCPKIIGKGFNAYHNKLTNIDCVPDHLGGYFYCKDNPIGLIFNEVDVDFLNWFKTFKPIKGNEINLKRLKYIMSNFYLPIDLDRIKKNYTIK